jgi:hypothetical protein
MRCLQSSTRRSRDHAEFAIAAPAALADIHGTGRCDPADGQTLSRKMVTAKGFSSPHVRLMIRPKTKTPPSKQRPGDDCVRTQALAYPTVCAKVTNCPSPSRIVDASALVSSEPRNTVANPSEAQNR